MLISEDNVKRGNWPLAIVEEIYQGKDGLVRTATLQTKMGKRRRSVQKLYLLEEVHSVEESLQNSEPIQSQSLPRISTGMRHATKVHTPGDKGKRNSTNNKDLDSTRQGGENVKSINYTRSGREVKAPSRLGI